MGERTAQRFEPAVAWVIVSREGGTWHPIPHTVSHKRVQAIAALEYGYDDDSYAAARKRGEMKAVKCIIERPWIYRAPEPEEAK